jgi:hypothetical protein
MTAAIAGMGSVSLEYHEERRALTDTEALGNCSCSRHSSAVDSSVSCFPQLNFCCFPFCSLCSDFLDTLMISSPSRVGFAPVLCVKWREIDSKSSKVAGGIHDKGLSSR